MSSNYGRRKCRPRGATFTFLNIEWGSTSTYLTTSSKYSAVSHRIRNWMIIVVVVVVIISTMVVVVVVIVVVAVVVLVSTYLLFPTTTLVLLVCGWLLLLLQCSTIFVVVQDSCFYIHCNGFRIRLFVVKTTICATKAGRYRFSLDQSFALGTKNNETPVRCHTKNKTKKRASFVTQ